MILLWVVGAVFTANPGPRGVLITCVKILRRAWVLYVVHIFLLAMLMGGVFFANSHVETRDLVEEMGMHHFIASPQLSPDR